MKGEDCSSRCFYRRNLSSSEYRQIKKKRAFAVHHPSPFFSFRETVPIERFSRCSGLHETPRRFCYTSNSWETYCFTQGLGSGEHEGDSVYFSSGKVVLMNCSRFYSLWPGKGEGRLELIGILHL